MAWPGQSRAARGSSGAEPRRGGGRAGRGVYGKRSLRGARPGAARSPVLEALSGRERWRPRTRGGARGSGSGRLSRAGLCPGSRGGGGSPVAEEAPELTRNPSVASLDLCLAQRGPIQCARSRGAPGKGKISRRITGHWIVRKHVVSRITFFPHCRCPVSVKPKVPGRGAVIPGAFELPGLTS